MDISRIRGICFDVDGTLSDTDDKYVQKLERIFSPFKFAFRNQEQINQFCRWIVMGLEAPGNFVYASLDRFGLDRPIALLFNALAKRQSKKSHHHLLVPGTVETVKALSQHYPLSIVSARDEFTTLSFLEVFKIRKYFHPIVCSQTCYYTKPFPDPVIHAAQKMGVRPEECLMIGDTTVDIKAGKSAGAQTAGVLCGFGREKELVHHGANIIVDKPADLIPILLENFSENHFS